MPVLPQTQSVSRIIAAVTGFDLLNAAYDSAARSTSRSHKQKFMGSNISVKDNKLIISIDTDENISLEKGLLAGRTSYFKEAFGLEPEIVVKRKR